MKKSLIILSLSIFAYTIPTFAADIGSYITYKLHRLNQNDSYITERIMNYDDDLGYFQLNVIKNKKIIAKTTVEKSSLISSKTIDYILKRCEDYGGKLESVNVYDRPSPACKISAQGINGVYTVSNFLNVGINYYDAILWIGHGPYNGILKYQRDMYIRSESFAYIVQDYGI